MKLCHKEAKLSIRILTNLPAAAAAAAKLLQSCSTLCDPIDAALPRPWDSPGKNTGVGRHFFLQCMKVKSEREVAQSCLTLCNPMDCSPAGCPPPTMGVSRQEYLAGNEGKTPSEISEHCVLPCH